MPSSNASQGKSNGGSNPKRIPKLSLTSAQVKGTTKGQTSDKEESGSLAGISSMLNQKAVIPGGTSHLSNEEPPSVVDQGEVLEENAASDVPTRLKGELSTINDPPNQHFEVAVPCDLGNRMIQKVTNQPNQSASLNHGLVDDLIKRSDLSTETDYHKQVLRLGTPKQPVGHVDASWSPQVTTTQSIQSQNNVPKIPEELWLWTEYSSPCVSLTSQSETSRKHLTPDAYVMRDKPQNDAEVNGLNSISDISRESSLNANRSNSTIVNTMSREDSQAHISYRSKQSNLSRENILTLGISKNYNGNTNIMPSAGKAITEIYYPKQVLRLGTPKQPVGHIDASLSLQVTTTQSVQSQNDVTDILEGAEDSSRGISLTSQSETRKHLAAYASVVTNKRQNGAEVIELDSISEIHRKSSLNANRSNSTIVNTMSREGLQAHISYLSKQSNLSKGRENISTLGVSKKYTGNTNTVPSTGIAITEMDYPKQVLRLGTPKQPVGHIDAGLSPQVITTQSVQSQNDVPKIPEEAEDSSRGISLTSQSDTRKHLAADGSVVREKRHSDCGVIIGLNSISQIHREISLNANRSNSTVVNTMSREGLQAHISYLSKQSNQSRGSHGGKENISTLGVSKKYNGNANIEPTNTTSPYTSVSKSTSQGNPKIIEANTITKISQSSPTALGRPNNDVENERVMESMEKGYQVILPEEASNQMAGQCKPTFEPNIEPKKSTPTLEYKSVHGSNDEATPPKCLSEILPPMTFEQPELKSMENEGADIFSRAFSPSDNDAKNEIKGTSTTWLSKLLDQIILPEGLNQIPGECNLGSEPTIELKEYASRGEYANVLGSYDETALLKSLSDDSPPMASNSHKLGPKTEATLKSIGEKLDYVAALSNPSIALTGMIDGCPNRESVTFCSTSPREPLLKEAGQSNTAASTAKLPNVSPSSSIIDLPVPDHL